MMVVAAVDRAPFLSRTEAASLGTAESSLRPHHLPWLEIEALLCRYGWKYELRMGEEEGETCAVSGAQNILQ